MIDGVLIFVGGTGFGVVIGASLAWHRFCRTERPGIELKVTPEVAEHIVDKLIFEWLQRRDLAVMPRGHEFHWPGQING
ncbi:MAG: hypothetical protein Q7U97_11670 [Rhodocyclaceae bacterium]|nr:hypothetical protein [Rhodocyclaceae bacterium]